MFAESLAANIGMRASICAAAERGLPIYAECGGLMYLGQGIEDLEGRYYAMAGVLSGRSVIKGTRLTLGYRTVRAMQNNCLLAAGETVRGHEFHFSSMQDGTATVPSAYEVLDQPDVKGSLCIMSSPHIFISIWVVKPVWRHASSPPAPARGD